MIVLEHVSKSFRMKNGQRKYVARDINALFPPRTSVALIGRNGAGKSTLLKIIGGTEDADSGRVLSSGDISWQIGHAGSFHPELSGAQNTRFLARVYGVDTQALEDFVYDFSELGPSFDEPIRTYSSGMRARLGFGICMGIPFGYYLIDEVTSVGDALFRQKCKEVLAHRLDNAGAVVVAHGEGMLREMCSAGAVLEDGVLTYFDKVDDALRYYKDVLSAAATVEG
ncbi:ABC transporter ATP-binding protein [Paracoccaceae bacterium GXU_MW_L88]